MVPRRRLLRALAMPVTLGAAGCTSFLNGDATESPTRASTPTVTPMTTLSPTEGSPTTSSRTSEPPKTVQTDAESRTPKGSPTPTISERVGTPALSTGPTSGVFEFGHAVGLSEGIAIVVAEEDGAHVFAKDDGWAGTAVLKPAEREDFGGYNVSAALVGEAAVVGGPGAGTDDDTGAVYLFERFDGEWNQRHRFTTDDEESVEFGKSVDFDGERVVVGDVKDPETMVTWVGGAYVFEGGGSNWTRVESFETGDQDLFGTAVGVDGETVLVGSPYASPGDVQTGAVYVYERVNGTWQRRAVLAPPAADGERQFGQSVAIDGDTAVVGAPVSYGEGSSAYVYERSESLWYQRARLTDPEAGTHPEFGEAVSIDDGLVVVSRPGGAGTGRVYVFSAADDWSDPLRLMGADPDEEADFGVAVDVAGSTALVGAPAYQATTGAYLFDV